MGADTSKIHAVKGLFILNESGFEELHRIIYQLHPIFIYIDPLSAYLDYLIDTNKENQVRSLMVKLAEIAERNHCAIMCIRHLTKSTKDKAMYRGQGSIAFTASVRSELMVGMIDGYRVMAHAKHNVGPRGDTLGYELEVRDGEKLPKLRWTGKIDEAGVEDLNVPEKKQSDSKQKIQHAVEFLEDMLANGPVEAYKIKGAAEREGVSEITLRRAKKELGTQVYRDDGVWYWE